MQRFRCRLVLKAQRLCVSFDSWLGSNKEEKKDCPLERVERGASQCILLCRDNPRTCVKPTGSSSKRWCFNYSSVDVLGMRHNSVNFGRTPRATPHTKTKEREREKRVNKREKGIEGRRGRQRATRCRQGPRTSSSLTLSRARTLSLSLAVSLSLSLSLAFSLSRFFSRSLFFALFRSLSLSLPLPLSPSPSPYPSLSLSRFLSRSLALSDGEEGAPTCDVPHVHNHALSSNTP